jgi:ketosteroid isomerase-like protein
MIEIFSAYIMESPVHETQEIRALLDWYVMAIRDRDAGAVIACYAADAVGYDLAPPLAIGSAQMHDPAKLQQWFDTWDGPIRSEVRNLTLRCGRDVGFAFALRHMTGTKRDGGVVDLWFRATATFVKQEGAGKSSMCTIRCPSPWMAAAGLCSP